MPRKHFMQRRAEIKDRNGMDLTEADDIRRGSQNIWKKYTKKS